MLSQDSDAEAPVWWAILFAFNWRAAAAMQRRVPCDAAPSLAGLFHVKLRQGAPPFAVPRAVVVRARHRNLVSRETDQVRRPVVYSGNRRADVLKRSSCSRKNRTRRSPAAVARLKQQRLSRQGSESRQLVSRETPAPWPQGGQHRAFPRFPSKQPAGSHRRLVLRSCSTIMALSLLASSVRACAIPHPL